MITTFFFWRLTIGRSDRKSVLPCWHWKRCAVLSVFVACLVHIRMLPLKNNYRMIMTKISQSCMYNLYTRSQVA